MADRIYVTLVPRYPRKRVFRMVSGSPLLRPRDADALRAELRRVAEESGMPLTFGGEVHEDTLLLTEFFGTRTGGMRGLAVLRARGSAGPPLWRGARCPSPTTAGPPRSRTTTTGRCSRRASSRFWLSLSWWRADRGRCSTAPTVPRRRLGTARQT